MIKSMLEELGFQTHVRILSDATASIAIAKRRGPGQLRHLEVKQFWVQDMVQSGRVSLHYLPSAENPADLLTKALNGSRHLKLRRMLGLRTSHTDEATQRPWNGEVNMLTGDFEIV